MPNIFGTRHHPHGRRSPSTSPLSSATTASGTASSHGTFSTTMMEENISDAEQIIARWDPQASSYARVTSLFQHSRAEARRFLRDVGGLRDAMHFFIADPHRASSSALLVRAQNLMQAAMRRLQKEFHQILSANRDRLDPESISAAERSSQLSLDSSTSSLSDLEEEELRFATDSIAEVERVSVIAMADLRSIAECMISAGYTMECIKVYKLIRRSIVDEGLYKLGFEKLSPTHVHKLDWDVLEIRIRNWVAASKVAVGTLFSGERLLCDHVFGSSDSIRESCFADISMEPAVEFFRFPELVALKAKLPPEKMFCFLDMYDSLTESWPEIESVFSYQLTSAVRSQAVSSLLKVGEAVRSMFANFESAIQKDNSRVAVAGGALHPLSRYVMNYVSLLADYGCALEDIFADYPLQTPTPLPGSFFDAPTSTPSSPSSRDGESYHLSPISVRLAWLILVLLCKLDSKAKLYREASLSYLFLANNLQYVVSKVRGSKLSALLGDEWVERHETKARGYAAGYERLAWSHVAAAIPDDPAEVAVMDAAAAEERMRRFNEAFEGAWRGQAGWTVADGRMRDELKLSIAGKLVPAYRSFYERCRSLLRGQGESTAVVRFAPEDLVNCLSDLFYAGTGAGTGSSVHSASGSSGSGSSHGSRRSG